MSYADIKARMGVPRSTLSKWFKGQKWSNDIATKCANRARNSGAIRLAVLNTIKRGRLENIRREARQDALLDFEEIKFHPLFIAGIISYWMHGDITSKNRVCFSSADHDKVSLFKLFLKQICGIAKPKMWINLRRGNLVYLAESYWSLKCGFSAADIGKTIISGKSGNNIQPILVKSKETFIEFKGHKLGKIGNKHGVCNMVVNSAYLKNKILKWIELMVAEMINEKYFVGDPNNVVN